MSDKIQKILANLGYGSRREIERWIIQGRINIGNRLAKLGDRASSFDVISLDGKAIHDATNPVERKVMLYHKAVGEICSHRDDEGKGSVFDRLPKVPTGSGRWVSIGRLDVNTSGLLLFTNDGALANQLMHPSSQIEREYAVRVLGKAGNDILKRLTQGVMLEDGMARFEHVVEASQKEKTGVNHWYYVVVTEGRNRLVRRLWESQDLKVNRLKRVRYGSVILGSMPKQGHYRELTTGEINALYETIKSKDGH